MPHSRRIILTTALAATVLLAIAGAASARRLRPDDIDLGIRWAPLSFIWGSTTTTCNVTLSGNLHSFTLTKTPGSLIGYITGGTINTCNAGAGATLLSGTLSWHVTYGAFAGVLPTISSVTLNFLGVSFDVDPAGALPGCLFRTDTLRPGRTLGSLNASGQVTGLTADRTASIDLEDPDALCMLAGDLEVENTGAVEDLAGNLFFITLVA